MLALVLAAALAAGVADQPASTAGLTDMLKCQDAYEAHWDKLMKAKDAGRHEDVLRELEPMEQACQGDPVAPVLTTLHAETDLLRGAPQEATARLDKAQIPAEHQIWYLSRWIYLAGLEVTGDAESFRRVRDEFLSVHDAALTAKAKKIERFETELAVVDAYETNIVQGPGFRRHFVFVAAPKNGGMPVTLTLTDSPATALLGGGGRTKPYAVDLYPCDSHATMGWIEAKKGKLPTYEQVKTYALKTFTDAQALPAFAKREEPRFCAFESYMLPGFD